MSERIYDKNVAGETAVYTLDWVPGGRLGSWAPDGDNTSINRYIVDFETMVQTNMDNGRKRSARIVYAPRVPRPLEHPTPKT